MFVLGTFARITLAATLAGSLVLALIGVGMAWRRFVRSPAVSPIESEPTGGARLMPGLLIAGMLALLVANVVVTAYWPFIAYDTQWVYGYNARIFVLRERIPDDMGYYPQLIPLAYTYMQQAWGLFHDPAINDHAARVIVPWFNATSVLMAYVLGKIAFGRRRVALLTAAVWAFYPHVAAWAGRAIRNHARIVATGAAAFLSRRECERTLLAVLERRAALRCAVD
jgi:hypothetical protein